MTNEYADKWRQEIGFPVHPACDALPDLSEKDFQKLVDDIKENGIREPAVYWQSDASGEGYCLVSGRHRYRAKEALGRSVDEVPTRDVSGGRCLDWVVSLDVRRRHLSKSEH